MDVKDLEKRQQKWYLDLRERGPEVTILRITTDEGFIEW